MRLIIQPIVDSAKNNYWDILYHRYLKGTEAVSGMPHVWKLTGCPSGT